MVKVDVSTNTSVFREGRNICVSEGTGFLVSSSHAITAEHVYNVPAECGERIILLKSRRHNLQVRATVVDALNDTALLRIDEPLPEKMCALRVIKSDVFSVPAFRFGIPGGLPDPTPMDVRIQDQDTTFTPLAVVTPTITELGESGGPVIHMFNVTGITRARHPTYRAYSFMMPASNIRTLLMLRYAVRIEGPVCNPVDMSAFTTDGVNAVARLEIRAPIDEKTKQEVFASAAAKAAAEATGPVRHAHDVGTAPLTAVIGDTLEIRTQSSPPPPGGGGFGGSGTFGSTVLGSAWQQRFENIQRVQQFRVSAAIARAMAETG